jgi:hypothetical protein
MAPGAKPSTKRPWPTGGGFLEDFEFSGSRTDRSRFHYAGGSILVSQPPRPLVAIGDIDKIRLIGRESDSILLGCGQMTDAGRQEAGAREGAGERLQDCPSSAAPPPLTVVRSEGSECWSEWQDSKLGPPRPERGEQLFALNFQRFCCVRSRLSRFVPLHLYICPQSRLFGRAPGGRSRVLRPLKVGCRVMVAIGFNQNLLAHAQEASGLPRVDAVAHHPGCGRVAQDVGCDLVRPFSLQRGGFLRRRWRVISSPT